MSDQLKPCPFCGSPAEESRDTVGSYSYYCTSVDCCALNKDFAHHATGRKAWNRRTHPPTGDAAGVEIIRELQKALFYWMPSIAGEDSPAGQKAAEHASLLFGLDDSSTDCEGDRMMQYMRIQNQAFERIELACRDAGCAEEMEFDEFIESLAGKDSVDAALHAEIERLRAIIDTPESNDFVKAILREAEHARVRWQHTDVAKTPEDWRGVLAILSQKALDAYSSGDEDKERHHIITTAGACYNWFRDRFGDAAIASLTKTADGEIKS